MDTVLSLLSWLPDTHTAQSEMCETYLPLRDISVVSKSCMRAAGAGEKIIDYIEISIFVFGFNHKAKIKKAQITSLDSAQGSQRREKQSWEPQPATECQE